MYPTPKMLDFKLLRCKFTQRTLCDLVYNEFIKCWGNLIFYNPNFVRFKYSTFKVSSAVSIAVFERSRVDLIKVGSSVPWEFASHLRKECSKEEHEQERVGLHDLGAAEKGPSTLDVQTLNEREATTCCFIGDLTTPPKFPYIPLLIRWIRTQDCKICC